MSAADRQRIVEYLTDNSQAMVGLLETLARAESPSSDATAQYPVIDILTGEFERLGFRVRWLPGRNSGGSLWARPEPRERNRGLQLLLAPQRMVQAHRFAPIGHGEVGIDLLTLAKDFDRFRQRMDNLSRHIQQANKDVAEVHTSAKKISSRFEKIEKVELSDEEAVHALEAAGDGDSANNVTPINKDS